MRAITKLLSATAVAAALAVVAAPAQATVYIGLSTDGGATITQVAVDPSVAMFNGPFGAWETNLVTSVSGLYPVLLGSSDHDNNATLVGVPGSSGAPAGTLDIFVTRDDINQPGATSIFSSFTSNLLPKNWTLRTRSYIDLSNGKFGGSLVSDHTFTGIGTFTQLINTPDPTGLFSVTGRYTITSTSAGQNLANITISAVPEPGTWGLMIMGFGGAGALLRSRRRTLAVAA